METIEFLEYLVEEPVRKNGAFSLLIYDITDNVRRAKFAKLMEAYGVRVQRSAFEIRVDDGKIKTLLNKIPKYISSADSVKLYKIRGQGEVYCWGSASMECEDDVLII